MSAVAEHSIGLDHCILLNNTSILAKESRHRDRLIKEAMEIKLHASNMKTEERSSLGQSWKPLVHPPEGGCFPTSHSLRR
jgi:hypothetical protein